MTITSNDIVLYQAQDNTDNDSGGGSRTASVVVDGDVNNLFPDISRIDTVVGRVNLRKVFPTVTTENRDVYYGAHAIVRKTPTDIKVSGLLFSTDSPHDNRVDAQNKIESYVVQSYKSQFYLYGNHVAGGKGITVLQTLESQTPDVGEVYLIQEGSFEQYIRIVDFSITELVIPFVQGSATVMYTRRRIDCQIDQVLEHAFTGSSFHPQGQLNGTASLFDTQIADASKFYSTKDIAESALENALSVKVDSIYTRLVPAATSNSFLNNEQALAQGKTLIPTGNLFSRSMEVKTGAITGVAIVPLSVSISTYYIDNGAGVMVHTSTGESKGTVDYINGIITVPEWNGAIQVQFQIAGLVSPEIQNTGAILVTQENSSAFWSRRLSPIPSVGNLYIDYRSQGKWYRISSNSDRDANGTETLGTDPSIGSGSLSDNLDGTGTLNLTLGSLPDTDSSVVISWGTTETVTDRSGIPTNTDNSRMVIDLGHQNIDPLSFTMQVYSEMFSAYKAVTADSSGVLIDTISAQGLVGYLDFINGEIHITDAVEFRRFESLPSSNDIIIDFDRYDVVPSGTGEVITGTATGVSETNGVVTFNLGSTVIQQSVRLSFFVDTVVPESFGSHIQRQEVNLTVSANGTVSGGYHASKFSGTVAANGDVVINLIDKVIQTKNPAYTGVYGTEPRYLTSFVYLTLGSNAITYKYQVDLADGGTVKTAINITDKYENIAVYKIQTFGDVVGEINFDFLDSDGTDNLTTKDGLVFTSEGLQVGSFNRDSGAIEMSCFKRPDILYLRFNVLFTDEATPSNGDNIKTAIFRTAANKLTTSSFQVIFEDINGVHTGTSDAEGVVTGDGVSGLIDVQTGLAHLTFAQAASAASIKYDAVAVTSLPLDPELLGLNPVRLPSDGRVPVFKSGYVVVIFNEVSTVVINGGTPVADQVNTLARSEQSYIEVLDVNGKRLNPDQYVADRILGTVTFGNPLSLVDKYGVALVAPFTIVDRIEDMRLAIDVQINGLISLNEGLSRDFPLIGTKISSALVWGDTGARVYNIFSQEIWSSGSPVWSDNRIGDNTTAQYDDVNFPIQIDNKSSSAGRWAIIFTSSTTVKVVNEVTGEAIAGVSVNQSTGEDVAPINPATMLPYFVMPLLGFGTGWVTNNVIRLNTDSGDNNMWVIRTVESGALSEVTDKIEIEIRGDAN